MKQLFWSLLSFTLGVLLTATFFINHSPASKGGCIVSPLEWEMIGKAQVWCAQHPDESDCIVAPPFVHSSNILEVPQGEPK